MKEKTQDTLRNEPKKLAGVTASLAVLATLVFSVPASAGDLIPVGADGVLKAEPGSVNAVASVTVAPENVGRPCTLTVISQNQVSVHNGNDLLISSGEGQWVIEDVEAEADAALDLSVDVELGQTILFELRMGPDSVSSLGFDMQLECEPLPEAEPLQQTAPIVPVGVPDHCPTTPDQPLTALPLECPAPAEPEPTTTTVPPTTAPPTTAAPTTTVPPATTVPPTTAPPATAAPADQNQGPEVLGIQVERLPQTPPALAVNAAPAYTG